MQPSSCKLHAPLEWWSIITSSSGLCYKQQTSFSGKTVGFTKDSQNIYAQFLLNLKEKKNPSVMKGYSSLSKHSLLESSAVFTYLFYWDRISAIQAGQELAEDDIEPWPSCLVSHVLGPQTCTPHLHMQNKLMLILSEVLWHKTKHHLLYTLAITSNYYFIKT